MVTEHGKARPWAGASTPELELRADFLLNDLDDLRKLLRDDGPFVVERVYYQRALETTQVDLGQIVQELRLRAYEGEQLIADSAAWRC